MTETERVDFEELLTVLATAAEKDRTTAEHHAARKEAEQEKFHRNRYLRNIRYLDACRAAKRKITSRETSKKNRSKFTAPEPSECIAYGSEVGLPASESQGFWDFYQSKEWKVGDQRMSDWKAAMRNWKRKWQEKNPGAKIGSKDEDPDGWREFLQSKSRDYKPYKYAPEHWQREFR